MSRDPSTGNPHCKWPRSTAICGGFGSFFVSFKNIMSRDFPLSPIPIEDSRAQIEYCRASGGWDYPWPERVIRRGRSGRRDAQELSHWATVAEIRGSVDIFREMRRDTSGGQRCRLAEVSQISVFGHFRATEAKPCCSDGHEQGLKLCR